MSEVLSGFVPEDVWNRLDSFFCEMQELGVVYVDHGVIDESGKYTGYFSHKEWGRVYIKEELFFREPILKRAKHGQVDISSWRAENQNNQFVDKKKALTEASIGVIFVTKEDDFGFLFNIGVSKGKDMQAVLILKEKIFMAYLKIFNHYHGTWRKKINPFFLSTAP